MTAENIAAALAGESQASQKYLAFADVADAEGYPNVARLFRAVAYAESTTPATTSACSAASAPRRRTSRLPGAARPSRSTRCTRPTTRSPSCRRTSPRETSIRYALTAEKDHQGIYDAVKGVEGKQDFGADAVRVCPICGHTVIGDAPDECPVCGTAGEYFKEF